MAKQEILPRYLFLLLVLGSGLRLAVCGYHSTEKLGPPLGNSPQTFLYPYENCSLSFDGQNVMYHRCLDLEGGFQLVWNLPSNSSGSHYVDFAFSGQSDNEWISIGKSEKGNMVNSSAMVGYSNGSNAPNVLQYYLAGRNVASVYPGGNLTIKGEGGRLSGGTMTIQFSLLLNETELNSTVFIWAKGPYDSSDGTLRYHKSAFAGLIGVFVDPVIRNASAPSSDYVPSTPSPPSSDSSDPNSSNSIAGCTFTFGNTTESYSNCQILNGGFMLMWNYAESGSASKISIAFNSSNTGYIGLGFGRKMIGTSAIVGRVSSSGVEVKQYSLTSYTPNENLPGGSLNVSDLQGETSSSSISMKFTIALPTSQASSANLIWAKGTYDSSQGDVLNEHSTAYSGSANFVQGIVTKGSIVTDKLKNSHGVVNAVGWGIIIPIGIIIARYFRASDPLWFYLHIIFQLVGFGLGLAGFITGIKIKERNNQTKNPHFTFGIIIIALSIFQVTALALRPKKGVSMIRTIWNFFHHWSGRTALILGVVNIYIGFDLLNPEKKYKLAFSIAFAILCAIALILEIAMCFGAIKRTPEKESTTNVESEMDPKKSAN